MSDRATRPQFVCSGCKKPGVKGIYCDKCRERKAQEREEAKEQAELERRRMMKERWKNEREDLIAAIKAGKEKP